MRRQGRYLDVDPGFGRRLSAMRKANGLSQAKFAGKIGATQRMVSNYERGQGRPRADLVGKMAKALGVSTEDLLIPKEARRRMAREKNILLDKLRRAEELTSRERETARKIIDVLLLAR